MDISKATVGFIASVSLVAGAGGAWLATHRNPSPSVATETAPANLSPSGAAGVEQTEGVISDAPPSTPTASAPAFTPAPTAAAPAPAPSPRTQPAARTRGAAARADRTAAPPPSSAPAAAPDQRPLTPPLVEAPRIADNEPVRPSAPPEPQSIDLVVPSDAVIGLQVETPVTSETARVEDQVIARVTRDVKVGSRVAIPSGAKAQGEVTLVERGGKLKDRARLGVRFTSVVLADGTRVPIETDTIFREGEGQGTQSAAKIGGGAIGGAIIGGILGGAKGAVIGGTAGAGAGTAVVMAGGRNAATLSAGAPVTVRLQQPATVTVDK